VDCDVAIVGAGPYGLSAAAHLRDAGLGVQVFGEPMSFWADTMPEGMLLRSPRDASTISDPKDAWGLEAYESANGLSPAAPVPLSRFVAYGKWFEGRLGQLVDRRGVEKVRSVNSHFEVVLKDRTTVTSRRVVIAAGIGPFRSTPAAFSHLPSEYASHCYEGRKTAELSGKRVAVIGAGQSALESAALLHEAGADVEVIARIPELRWIGQHGWLHHLGPVSKLLYAKHDVGPMGISRLVAYPKLMSRLPSRIRERIRTRAIRAAGSAWLPGRLAGAKLTTGRVVNSATLSGGRVSLALDDGSQREVEHVLLGTGYRVDITRYDFLPPDLAARVQRVEGWPLLGSGFQSSVPGLHFLGAPAAHSFGPLLHFVAGTEFSSRELVRSLGRSRTHA
jgi:hypothetical protein